MAFLSADLKLKLLAGGKFPGPKGGGWFGVVIEPAVGGMTVFVSQTIPATRYSSSSSQSSTVFGLRAGGSLGFQIMHFGALDEKSLKQNGVAFMLAGYGGATGISGADGFTFNASFGPVIGLSFPSYNAGTASYSAFSITGMVLPTGGSIFMSLSLGWIF